MQNYSLLKSIFCILNPSLYQRIIGTGECPTEYTSLRKLYGALRSLKFLVLTFVAMVTHQFAQI